MRMGAGGMAASKDTPKGMPTTDPMSNQRRERQSISFQTCGNNRILASTSRISTVGTTTEGASTSDILVTATIANPKPLYPRMIPARKTAAIETIKAPSSIFKAFKKSNPKIS